jgi:hypothetical protein
MKKRILILVLSDLRQDARVRRQIDALKDSYDLTVVCFGAEPSTAYQLVILPPVNLTFFKKFLSSIFLITGIFAIGYRILHPYYQFLLHALQGQKFDLTIANDVETLPVAFRLENSRKIMFDAHEYAPRHFEDKLMWRIFFKRFNTWLCRKYIPMTAAMTTVGRMLALEYEKHFGVKPQVITNAGHFTPIGASVVLENRIRLVHHGIATPSRNLHLMIELIDHLDERFTMVMYLLKPSFASQKTANYIQQLQTKATGHPRLKILPPLAGTELVKTINQYDIGVFLLPPVNFNYRNTLPNKLFDFIQARLGVAIGPTPEMAEIVKAYDNGVVSEDFTPVALANELNKLTKKDVERFKANSEKAAGELNAEDNKLRLLQIVNQITG